MANIGDVVTFKPKVGDTPSEHERYVVCSRGPEYVMADVRDTEKALDWVLLFVNNKPLCKGTSFGTIPVDITFVSRMTVKALGQVYTRNEMESIKKLINEEKTLKEQMKALRADLKKGLEASELYKAVLENTLASREPKVSQKLAKAHALKVARAAHESDDEEDDDGDN
jgi:hypothetical protein